MAWRKNNLNKLAPSCRKNYEGVHGIFAKPLPHSFVFTDQFLRICDLSCEMQMFVCVLKIQC